MAQAELEVRVSKLESKVAIHAHDIERHDQKIDDIEVTLDGDRDGVGLKGRFSSVEEAVAGFRRAYFAMLGCAGVILLQFLWDLITHQGSK